MNCNTRHHVHLDRDSFIAVSKHSSTVSLLLGLPSDATEFSIDFQPCHLPKLRELILELEAVQDFQRQREEATA